MTIQDTSSDQQYTGDGVVTIFSFDMKTLDPATIFVYINGGPVITGFTTTLNLDQETSPGGNVTFDVAPADGASVSLLRELPLNQETDYVPYDPFPANSHERALDKLTAIDQQLQEQIDRLNLPPPGTIPDDNANVDGNLTVGGFITSGLAPTDDNQVTRKDYVDAEDATLASGISTNSADIATLQAEQPLSGYVAHGRISEAGVLSRDNGLFTAVRENEGDYTITFVTPQLDNEYVVQTSQGLGNVRHINIESATPTAVRIKTRNISDADADAIFFITMVRTNGPWL